MLNKLKLVDDTRIERLIRCCILLGLCVTLAGVIIVVLLHSFQDSQMISCKTDTCKKISRELFRQLDKNVSACSDFAEHVCGKKQGLFKNNEETHYTMMMKHIHEMVQENPKVAEVPLFVDAIEFYRSCTNQESRNAARYADLFEIYKEIGGWPLLQNRPTFSSYGFRFERPLIDLYRKIKRNYFFDLEIATDQLGSKVVFIKKYSRIFKNDARWIFKYKEHIKEIVRLIHPNPDELDESELEKNVDELVNFEQKLNDVSFDNPLSIELNMFNLTNFDKNMDWSLVFSSMVENVRIFYPEYNEMISIGRDATRHINKLLRSGKIFLNYLGWKVTEHYASFTTIKLLKLRENFLQDTDEERPDPVREEEEKPVAKEELRDFQNRTIKTPSTDEFDQVSSNLKEMCSKQTIVEFQKPIDFVFRQNFLHHNFHKLNDLLKSIVGLISRKLENAIWSDDELRTRLSEKMRAVKTSEILERSPKSTYCYEYNFAIEDAKSFVGSVVHIESFNHLNELCLQTYQKESKKRFNNERTRNFELETRTYIPLTNVADSTTIPDFFLISRFGTLISSYLLKNVILIEENASLMSYELKHLFNSKLNCFKEQLIGEMNYRSIEQLYDEQLVIQSVIQTESVNLAQELFYKNDDHFLENQQVTHTHNLNQLFFIAYVHGYCHLFNSKTQHNQLFKTLVNFSTIKNSQIFFDVFNCVPASEHTERCTLF